MMPRLVLVLLPILALGLAGCNTVRVIEERNEARQAYVELADCVTRMDSAAIQQVQGMGFQVRADGCLSTREIGQVMTTLLRRDAEAQALVQQARTGGLSPNDLLALLLRLLF